MVKKVGAVLADWMLNKPALIVTLGITAVAIDLLYNQAAIAFAPTSAFASLGGFASMTAGVLLAIVYWLRTGYGPLAVRKQSIISGFVLIALIVAILLLGATHGILGRRGNPFAAGILKAAFATAVGPVALAALIVRGGAGNMASINSPHIPTRQRIKPVALYILNIWLGVFVVVILPRIVYLFNKSLANLHGRSAVIYGLLETSAIVCSANVLLPFIKSNVNLRNVNPKPPSNGGVTDGTDYFYKLSRSTNGSDNIADRYL
jgi:hypothetical protein